MKRLAVISTVGLLLMGLAAWGAGGSAGRPSQLLTGELWQTMSPDAKTAFVWGIGNLAEFERARGGPEPAGSRSFIPFLVKGLRGKPINDVVREVDTYYQAHPEEIGRPVLDAIFQAIVLPALRAEKGGDAK